MNMHFNNPVKFCNTFDGRVCGLFPSDCLWWWLIDMFNFFFSIRVIPYSGTPERGNPLLYDHDSVVIQRKYMCVWESVRSAYCVYIGTLFTDQKVHYERVWDRI